jgi:ankyrin repeat protein
MTDSAKKINHSLLLQIANTLIPDFKNNEGLCEGINTAFLQAVATGKTEKQEFYARLKFLSNYLSVPGNTVLKLKKEINDSFLSQKISKGAAAKKLKQAEKGLIILTKEEKELLQKQAKIELEVARAARPILTEEKRKLQDVLAFFNTVVIGHNTTLGSIFNTGAQFEKNEIYPTMASKTLEDNKKYIHTNGLGIVVANKEELIDYFTKIEATLNTTQDPYFETTSFLLASDDHTLSIYFDQSTSPGKWCFFDINDLKTDEKGNYNNVSQLNSSQLADLVFKGLQDDENTGFSIRRLSTQGYDLALMQDYEWEIKTRAKLPPIGKLYLSEEGKYIFRDGTQVHEGHLPQNHGVDLTDLKEKLYDFSFRTAILKLISKDAHTPSLVNNLDKKINAISNDLLDKVNLRTKTNSRGRDALSFAIQLGQLTLVNRFIQEGVNIESPWENENGQMIYPLQAAATGGHTGIINALLKASPNTTKEDLNSALLGAALEGHLDAINALIAAGANGAETFSTALIYAALNGHHHVFNTLITAGANINATDENGQTALMWAAQNDHLDTVNALIKKGALINTFEKTGLNALSVAALKGHTDVVNSLVLAKASINAVNIKGMTALMWAAYNGHVETLNALIQSQANINMTTLTGQSALRIAAQKNKIGAVRILIKAGADLPPLEDTKGLNLILRLSAKEGYVEMLQKAISAGAAIDEADASGITPLMLAVSEGHIDIVNYLVSIDADRTTTTSDEETALVFAIGKADLEIVKALTKDKNTQVVNASLAGGLTMLMLAAQNGELEILNILLEAGADVLALDKDGCTALMLAAANGHIEIVDALLKAGANKNAADNEGKTALIFATENGHQNIVALLTPIASEVLDALHSKAVLFHMPPDHTPPKNTVGPSQHQPPAPKTPKSGL